MIARRPTDVQNTRRLCRRVHVVGGVLISGILLATWTPLIILVYLNMISHSEESSHEDEPSVEK